MSTPTTDQAAAMRQLRARLAELPYGIGAELEARRNGDVLATLEASSLFPLVALAERAVRDCPVCAAPLFERDGATWAAELAAHMVRCPQTLGAALAHMVDASSGPRDAAARLAQLSADALASSAHEPVTDDDARTVAERGRTRWAAELLEGAAWRVRFADRRAEGMGPVSA